MVRQKTMVVVQKTAHNVGSLWIPVSAEFNSVCLNGISRYTRETDSLSAGDVPLTSIFALPSASESIGGIGSDGDDSNRRLSG